MNFKDLFSKTFNEKLAKEILNILDEDLTTPYKLLTLKLAELYDNAKPGARKESLRQIGLQYARKAELDGENIFLEEITLLAETDYPSISDVFMTNEESNTFANKFLKGYNQNIGLKYGPHTFYTIEQLDEISKPKTSGNQNPNFN